MLFAQKLIHWFLEKKRNLPWRDTQDPYHIWISEIILQQTRVNQGYDYYLRFLEKFPNVETLANAPEEEVMKLWQGLGYYSRARNIHTAAKQIMQHHAGVFPQEYKQILELKGIGKYTAAAISSFAFKYPQPVVDGNVYRFIARLYGIYTPINSAKAYTEFETLLLKQIDKEQPDMFNQAIMEFGALHCKPQNPLCDECIFSSDCVAFKENKQKVLPIKENKVKVRDRFFYFLAFEINDGSGEYTILQKRTEKDIWTNLYQFPLIESPEKLDNKLLKAAISNFLSIENISENNCKIEPQVLEIKHQLTHQTLYAHFVSIQSTVCPQQLSKTLFVAHFNELKTYAVPRLIDMFLKKKQYL